MLVLTLAASTMAADCSMAPVHVDGVAFTSLASALAGADPGSTIEVCAGTYPGPLVAPVPVAVVGLAGSEATVLDGGFLGTVLTLPGGSSVTGLTVTGGAALTNGGGIVLSSPGRLDVVDSQIVDNHAEDLGGGLFVPGGSEVHFVGSRVAENTAQDGGGLANDAGLVGLALNDSVFEANEALGAPSSPFSAFDGRGGAIYLAGGWITGGLITGNLAFNDDFFFFPIGSGGGIEANGPVSIERTHIVGNTARNGGGLGLNGDAVLEDVVVEGNHASSSGGGIDVGSLQDVVTITAFGSVIRDNTTNGSGGGIATFTSADSLRWEGGRVVENFARSSGGGWYSLHGFTEVVGVEFRDNVSQRYGGGLGTSFGSTFFPASMHIDGCTFVGNAALDFDGGGADLGLGGTIEGSTFEGNHAGGSGGALTMFGFGRPGVATQYYLLQDSTFEHNSAAGLGGAMIVETDAVSAAFDVSVFDNRAADGGAVAVIDGEITLTDSDLGQCPDNLPDDISIPGTGASERGLADVTSLRCDSVTGCAPAVPPLLCVDPAAPACVDPSASVGNAVTLGARTQVREEARIRDRAALGLADLIDDEAKVGVDAVLGDRLQACRESDIRDRGLLGADVTLYAEVDVGVEAVIGDDVVIGRETRLRDRVAVDTGARLGEEVVVGPDAIIGAGARLGDEVRVGDRARIGDGAQIGARAIIGVDAVVPPGTVVPAGGRFP